MITFEKRVRPEFTPYTITDIPEEKIMYFDIETTGLSPKTSFVYLIGALYLSDDGYVLKQWFADTLDCEKEILSNFMEFSHNFEMIIHYNGAGFDIPFIIKKCEIHNIPCDFSGIKSFDIYKKISPLKKLFSIDNLKQKSIEAFLNIKRMDMYSGGELINAYYEYLQKKDDKLRELLLLHNHDDVLGMQKIMPIVNYECLVSGGFAPVSKEIEADKFSIELTLDSFLPKRISGGNNNFHFTACKNTAIIDVRIYNGELKYFYPNYKDYYYLPDEDKSIHKSVAFYVDKNFRTKAKAANCYGRKTGMFLPQYEEIITPYFKIDYYDKITYFELSDENINDDVKIKEYCRMLFNKICSGN